MWSGKEIDGFKLLYRASENDFSTEKFHELCDNKKELVVWARTELEEVIGGYNSTFWDGNKMDMNSEEKQSGCFLFSLTKRQKFFIHDKSQGIVHKGMKYGPTFGDRDFWIGDRSNSESREGKEGSIFDIGNSYTISHKFKDKKEAVRSFTGEATGKAKVRVVEWEVFEMVVNEKVKNP